MNEFKNKRQWGPTPNYPSVEIYGPMNNDFISVAGPCFVESMELINAIASFLGKLNVKYLRGGCFRAGTYPPQEFGLQYDKLEMLHIAAKENGMLAVSEVLDSSTDTLDLYDKYLDAFQVGARQMQNYNLLRLLALRGKTIFLKRNMGATIDEWLGAAEYIIKYGGHPVLVERGSSTHMNHVRWDLSISSIPAVKAIAPGLPVIVDPSHGTGRRDLVEPMLMAGIAAGADGFMIETHPEPDSSISDKEQAITVFEFQSIFKKAMEIWYVSKT